MKNDSPPHHELETVADEAFFQSHYNQLQTFYPGLTLKRFQREQSELKLKKQDWLIGRPLAYWHGKCEFYDLEIKVNQSVLIPRPETEYLVDLIVQEYKFQNQGPDFKVLDLCCGSGCIGLALKSKFPQWSIVLSDISSAALSVAQENAKRLNLDVRCVLSDLGDKFQTSTFDLIISNPPYVPASGGIDPSVRFEPAMAIFVDDAKYEDFFSRLFGDIKQLLKPGGRFMMEGDSRMMDLYLQLLYSAKETSIQVKEDLSGAKRFLFLSNS